MTLACHHHGLGVPAAAAATLRLSPTKLSSGSLLPLQRGARHYARHTLPCSGRRRTGPLFSIPGWGMVGGARGFSHENILILANFSRFSHGAMQLSVML